MFGCGSLGALDLSHYSQAISISPLIQSSEELGYGGRAAGASLSVRTKAAGVKRGQAGACFMNNFITLLMMNSEVAASQSKAKQKVYFGTSE